jgi:hypothetical protein
MTGLWEFDENTLDKLALVGRSPGLACAWKATGMALNLYPGLRPGLSQASLRGNRLILTTTLNPNQNLKFTCVAGKVVC